MTRKRSGQLDDSTRTCFYILHEEKKTNADVIDSILPVANLGEERRGEERKEGKSMSVVKDDAGGNVLRALLNIRAQVRVILIIRKASLSQHDTRLQGSAARPRLQIQRTIFSSQQ